MAQLRRNHEKNKRGGQSFAKRIGTFTLLLIGAICYGFYECSGVFDTSGSESSYHQDRGSESGESYDDANPVSDRSFLPKGNNSNQVVHHKYYSLSYNDTYEIPEWVAYELTSKSLKAKNVPRAKKFKIDPDVKRGSAKHSDYTRSGYTRGHMAPAGDMAFSKTAMQETFYMSNMAPQVRDFNNGIWRELEEQVRDWAYDDKALYVVSGPIMDGIQESIGKNDVGVPKAFYKILLDMEGRDKKAIAFIMPHARSDKRIQDYAVTVDEVEQRTGIDFFPELTDDIEEERLESSFNIKKWKFDNKRYRLRVEKWNKQ